MVMVPSTPKALMMSLVQTESVSNTSIPAGVPDL